MLLLLLAALPLCRATLPPSAYAHAPVGGVPSNFAEIECAFHCLAAEMSLTLTPQLTVDAISAALHLDDCPDCKPLLDRFRAMDRASKPAYKVWGGV